MPNGRQQIGLPGTFNPGPYARAGGGGGQGYMGQLGSMLGQQAAPLLMGGIKGLKAGAMNEGSDGKAEDDAKKYNYLQNDPQLLEEFLQQNEYYQKHPRGLKYLKALLQKQPRVQPGALSPAEAGQWQQQRAGAAFGGLPTGGQPFAPGQPRLQAKAAGAIAPQMAGMGFPQQRYAPGGVPPEAQAGFFEKLGLKKPATAREAAGARVTGAGMPEVPSDYTEWIKGKERRFEEITDGTEKALAGFLTMGTNVFQNLPQEPDDLLFEYNALLGDKALLQKLGIPLDKGGEPDLKAWNNAAFEAKGWEEKLNAYLHLITAVQLSDKAREWVFFNWFGGGPEEPLRAKREWSFLEPAGVR